MFSVNNLEGDSSYLGRVLTSLTRSGGPGAGQTGQQPTGHVITSLPGPGLCLVAVCRDHNLRVWSLNPVDYREGEHAGELDIGAVYREGECTVFSSRLGMSIVTGSLRQRVDTKLELAQRLLVCYSSSPWPAAPAQG